MPDTNVTIGGKKPALAKLKVGSNVYIDLKKIGLPGWQIDDVDVTNLGSTLKEKLPGDVPEITQFDVVAFFDAALLPMLTAGITAMEIHIPSLTKKWAFSGYIKSDKPGDLEQGKAMDRTITIVPTTVVTPGSLT